MLRGLQPQREKPNKYKGKRFAAGELQGNQLLHVTDHEVEELQYWTVTPSSQTLKNAKLFLLGQINLILVNGKLKHDAENNPSTEVMLTIYSYDQESDQCSVNGRTAVLKAPTVLHVNVCKNDIHVSANTIKLSTADLAELRDYLPFSNDIDISSRLHHCL